MNTDVAFANCLKRNPRTINLEEVLAPLRMAIVSETDFFKNNSRDVLERFCRSDAFDAISCYHTVRHDTPSSKYAREILHTNSALEIKFYGGQYDVIDNFECSAPYRMFMGMNSDVEVPLGNRSVVIYNTYFQTRFIIDIRGIKPDDIVFKYRSFLILDSSVRRRVATSPLFVGNAFFDHLTVLPICPVCCKLTNIDCCKLIATN